MKLTPVQREALELLKQYPDDAVVHGSTSTTLNGSQLFMSNRTAEALQRRGLVTIDQDRYDDYATVQLVAPALLSDVEIGQQQAREAEALTRLAELTDQPEGLLRAAVDVHRTRSAAAVTASLVKSVWAGSAGRAPDPLAAEARTAHYHAQTGSGQLTPAQRRRAAKKSRKH